MLRHSGSLRTVTWTSRSPLGCEFDSPRDSDIYNLAEGLQSFYGQVIRDLYVGERIAYQDLSTTKAYSGLGADIVMESITFIDMVLRVAGGNPATNSGNVCALARSVFRICRGMPFLH